MRDTLSLHSSPPWLNLCSRTGWFSMTNEMCMDSEDNEGSVGHFDLEK